MDPYLKARLLSELLSPLYERIFFRYAGANARVTIENRGSHQRPGKR